MNRRLFKGGFFVYAIAAHQKNNNSHVSFEVSDKNQINVTSRSEPQMVTSTRDRHQDHMTLTHSTATSIQSTVHWSTANGVSAS